MGILSDLEKQQLQFDWRYKGVSILNLLSGLMNLLIYI